MKKKKLIMPAFFLCIFLFAAFFAVYRYVGVGGKIVKIEANRDKGFYTEYYLFIPDTLNAADQTFLLVECNNTGSVDDNHKTHRDAAYNTIRFGQSNRIARKLGVPLIIPCFDRPETDWQMYTHALDRDTLLCENGALSRIDRQLNSMIDDARTVLRAKNIYVQDKVLLNGFSASGSFANRFAALYPERVAAVAAGGLNSMAILPMDSLQGHELIYPVGISDIKQIADLTFQLSAFANVPQYYYMGAEDENDSLPFDDAYSNLERKIITEVLGEDMKVRWENCQKLYESQSIEAQFHTFQGIGHETSTEIDKDITSFFAQVMDEYK
ncbi:alpha/beta hydrolase [Oscillospiraceae bacterium MB08-C2-2]|nr:alpha/beta hydrolase [Oscillospiraceae bacterium MB08-C2-2]